MKMRKEGGLDRGNKNHLWANQVTNCVWLAIDNQLRSTNSTSWAEAGRIIFPCCCIRKRKLADARFYAGSGTLAADGLDVQLYDLTNAAQIALINFLGTEDDTVKWESFLSYFNSISDCGIIIQMNYRKAGPIGPSEVAGGMIFFGGRFST